MSQYNIAILGATGAVGEAMLDVLEDRQFPIKNLSLLASAKSAGTPIEFKGETYDVMDVADFDFSQADIALFSAGGSVSEHYAPIAADAGCVVIDNTSHFRYDVDVPLVIPEVNPDDISWYHTRNIIANPNCSTIQMLVALKPIHDAVGITRINVCTYQAVSGAGRSGIDELLNQTAKVLNGHDAEVKTFSKQIAFNVLPHIDAFQDNGYTREEMKMVWETHKILGDEHIRVNPTAVRVPVFYGHSEAVNIETRDPLSVEEAKVLLKAAPGVIYVEKDEDYPTAVSEAIQTDAVFVGRLRQDISHEQGLNMWVVADNTRKGAALNAVQIAELLTPYLSEKH